MALWQRSPDHARGRSAVPFCVSYLWMMSTAFRINRKRPPTKVSGLLVVEVTRLELAASASRTQRSTKLSHTSMAARLGFEPRQTESESVVLPLHNRAICTSHDLYYIAHLEKVKSSADIFGKMLVHGGERIGKDTTEGHFQKNTVPWGKCPQKT